MERQFRFSFNCFFFFGDILRFIYYRMLCHLVGLHIKSLGLSFSFLLYTPIYKYSYYLVKTLPWEERRKNKIKSNRYKLTKGLLFLVVMRIRIEIFSMLSFEGDCMIL